MARGKGSVGFIGAGGIGRPMAERLAAVGFDLTVCDVRPAALDPFAALGATVTTRPATCGGADVVIVMVADDAQAYAVIAGEDGLAQGIDPERPPIVAVMSTIMPATIERIAAALAPARVRVVDAPVSGGPLRAARGDLSIIVGGEAADLAALLPVLDALGSRIFPVGARGRGEAVKILNNLVAVTIEFLMTELVLIARPLGIDAALLFEVMEASSGRNFLTADAEAFRAAFRNTTSDPALLKAHVDICRKDLRLAEALAAQHGVAAPLLSSIATAHRALSYDQTMAARTIVAEGPAR